MNTRIHVILEILPNSFGIGEKILKYWNGVHKEIKGFSSSFTKKNTKKRNFKKRNKRASSWACVDPKICPIFFLFIYLLLFLHFFFFSFYFPSFSSLLFLLIPPTPPNPLTHSIFLHG